jgi:hypothetical protein
MMAESGTAYGVRRLRRRFGFPEPVRRVVVKHSKKGKNEPDGSLTLRKPIGKRPLIASSDEQAAPTPDT